MTMLCCALADQPFNSSDTGMDTVAPEDTESEKGEIYSTSLILIASERNCDL